MSYSMTDPLPAVIDPPVADYDDGVLCGEYRDAGEECARHEDNYICSECHNCAPSIAIVHHDDYKRGTSGEFFTTIATEFLCGRCFEGAGDDYTQCTECGDWWHVDLEMVAANVCLACDDKELTL